MSVFINTFLLIYAGLFPIVNPIGNAPLFLSMTRWQSDSTRAQLARRVAVNSTFLLLGSLLVGSHLLVFFGISLPVVRIAGGLVVTAFVFLLLSTANLCYITNRLYRRWLRHHADGGGGGGANANANANAGEYSRVPA